MNNMLNRISEHKITAMYHMLGGGSLIVEVSTDVPLFQGGFFAPSLYFWVHIFTIWYISRSHIWHFSIYLGTHFEESQYILGSHKKHMLQQPYSQHITAICLHFNVIQFTTLTMAYKTYNSPCNYFRVYFSQSNYISRYAFLNLTIFPGMLFPINLLYLQVYV